MKCMLWTVVLAAMFVLSAVPAAAAKNENEIPTAEQMEQHEKLREFRAREAEFEHEQSLRGLELDERRAKIEQMGRGPHGKHGDCGGLVLLIIVVNILLTVWVFKDMREQKIGRALWVPITLLAGVFGAIIYAIVRNADVRRQGRGR